MGVRNSGSWRPRQSRQSPRSPRPWRSGPASAGRGGLALAAAALVVASCQSGGSGAAGIVPAATSAPPGPSQASVVSRTPAEPTLRAEDYVLTEGAITAGFTASPADPQSNSDDLTMVQVAQCLGIPAEQFSDERLDTADGPDFTSDVDELVTMSSSAQIVTEEKVAADLEILNNPRFAECFGQTMQAEFDADTGGGATFEIVAAESLAPPAGASGLLRISVGMTAGGETVGLVLDKVFFFEGQVEVVVNYTNVDNTPPQVHLQRIADQISGKLQIQ